MRDPKTSFANSHSNRCKNINEMMKNTEAVEEQRTLKSKTTRSKKTVALSGT